MKRFITYSILAAAAFLLFSCSDDFVNEQIGISGVAESSIAISPDWEADDYPFLIEGAGTSDFSVISKPDWLVLSTNSGSFENDTATIRCKANTVANFSETGIYLEQMLVSVGGKKYAIPVYYITEGNPSVQVQNSFIINYNDYNPWLQISNTGDGILFWEIVSMPKWLSVNSSQFDPTSVMLGQGTTASVPFVLNVEAALNTDSTGTIVLRTNDKSKPQVQIYVIANLGTPKLSVSSYDTPVDFGTSTTSKTFDFSNNGNGILAWGFDGLPAWLTISKSNGTLYSYNWETVALICDRSKLPLPGLNSATIYLKSNDSSTPSYPLTVTARAPGSNANIRALEGNIVDASFDKNKNILYYATSQPNKLIAYDVAAKSILHEVALSKAPTCLAISEDFTKALTGHGGVISVVDLNNHSVSKTIDIIGTVADVEFAANNWCAYTEGGNYNIQHTTIYWVNLSDGSLTEGSHVYEDCLIKKVPNLDYLIGSETEVSSGVYVYDINNRTEKADIFESFRNFWFAGNYIISLNGAVYRVSDVISQNGYTSGGISPIGELQYPEDDYYGIQGIDYCSSIHAIFGLKRKDYQTISSSIYQFEDNDYSLVKTYMYDNLYQPDTQTTAYEVEARYLFANGSGTELSVLRKGLANSNWSIEFIPIQD
ncbi:MAG: BACON domain-containing protein [Mangrovibacterium sp.]